MLMLWSPLASDQALFSLFASRMEDGSALYRDVWDAKQPGIFWFYQAAGWALGSDATKVHVFELLWLLGHASGMAWFLRSRLRSPWVAGLVPAAVALFYVTSDIFDLTQIEILVSPMIGWLCLLLADPKRKPAMFAAGVVAGLIAVFKLLLLLVPAVLLLVGWFSWGVSRAEKARLLGFFVLGFAVPATLLLLWVWRNDLTELVWWTWVELPLGLGEVAPRPLERLIRSAGAFTAAYALPLLIGVTYLARNRKALSPVARLLIVAILACAVSILLQYWWGYHFALLVFPVGLLAVMALDETRSGSTGTGRWQIVAAVLLSAPVLAIGAAKLPDLWGMWSGRASSGTGRRFPITGKRVWRPTRLPRE